MPPARGRCRAIGSELDAAAAALAAAAFAATTLTATTLAAAALPAAALSRAAGAALLRRLLVARHMLDPEPAVSSAVLG